MGGGRQAQFVGCISKILILFLTRFLLNRLLTAEVVSYLFPFRYRRSFGYTAGQYSLPHVFFSVRGQSLPPYLLAELIRGLRVM